MCDAVLASVQVHYSSFPEDVLLRWDGMEGMKAHHFSSMKVSIYGSTLKHSCGQRHSRNTASMTAALSKVISLAWAMLQEAACICEGKAKPVMDLPTRDKDSLWEAITKVSSLHCTIFLPLANPGSNVICLTLPSVLSLPEHCAIRIVAEGPLSVNCDFAYLSKY